jgi:hypothetical protein
MRRAQGLAVHGHDLSRHDLANRVHRNHISLARPNAAMLTQSSAPQMTAAMAITAMSISLWRRLVASRGSSTVEKWTARDRSRFSAVNALTPHNTQYQYSIALPSHHLCKYIVTL